MTKINLLDAQLSNMIAAGEVVERPSSVIKELVENAIDAKATVIEVFIHDAGRTLMEVLDNGSGMSKEDALLSIQRHATSKIHSAFDLFKIKTLGFRGEALPSIASVSLLTLTTSDGTEGTTLTVENHEVKVQSSPLKQGTYVSVKELFYNTPARLKYLKSDAIENASTIETMMRIALSHPSIAFSLSMDGKLQFKTTGRGDLKEVITTLYGLSIAQKLIPISMTTPDFQITGFLGKPEIAKSHRYGLITLLNGRSVYMPKINKTIIDAYHGYLPVSRFPMVFLSMTMDASLVDVNVHPTKKEVRLSKEAHLMEALLKAIANNLRATPLPKEIITPDTPAVSYENPSPAMVQDPLFETMSLFDQNVSATKTTLSLTVLGQLALTYILAEDDQQGLYLIDQHAADERINYEKNLARAQSQLDVFEPIIPIMVDLKKADLPLWNEQKKEQLASIGIVLSPFGGLSFKVESLPIWAHHLDGYAYVISMLDQVLHGEPLTPLAFRELSIATRSCKTSIKANERLSIEQMQTLVNRLVLCEQPYHCPHGRPTIIHFDQDQIEKWFNRTGF
jgi:DNA mismatch repair protein MutL